MKIPVLYHIEKAWRQFFRRRRQKKYPLFYPENNIITSGEQGNVKVIIHGKGKNNVIKLGSFQKDCYGTLEISIFGDNNTVEIGDDVRIGKKLTIEMGHVLPHLGDVENVHVKIGQDTGIEECTIVTFNSNNRISIGQSCMFSEKVLLYNTDAHPVYDRVSRKLLNQVTDMTIGNHVWLAQNVTIFKNVVIPDGCIVGGMAVVTKHDFSECNCVIAGNPARIVKRNIDWGNSDKNYIANLEHTI